MTAEEKAKAYDEALKRIKGFYQNYDNISNLVDVKRELEAIFPQLCESEDEQTRKRLIDFISNIKEISESGRNSWAIRKDDAEMCNTFLSYLEKQKDHFRDDTKKVELQDYSCLTDLERAIHRGFLSAGVENVPVTIIKETANECKRIANENANAEWSDEDESFYDSIMCEVVKEGMHPTPEQANWFKSLPERFNFQPKQEWSDEDKKDVAHIIRILDDCYAYGRHDLSKTDHENLVNKLKSLRPQPHWKPSNAQINYLGAAVIEAQRRHNESVNGFPRYHALKELYEQLLKL